MNAGSELENKAYPAHLYTQAGRVAGKLGSRGGDSSQNQGAWGKLLDKKLSQYKKSP